MPGTTILNSGLAASPSLSAAAPMRPVPSDAGPTVSPQSASDTFNRLVAGKISEGFIRPTGNPVYSIPVELTADGTLIQKMLSGPQVVGQLDEQGNYRLSNGWAGNLFRDDTLQIFYEQGDSPFLQSLRMAERRQAATCSEIPNIRARLTQSGLDGRGVKVGILDAYEHDGEAKDGEQAQWRVHHHSYAVASIINSPVWGVAPGTQVIDAGFKMPDQTEPKRDDLLAYMSIKAKDYCRIYDTTRQQLENILRQPHPGLRVLNLTWGSSRVKMAMDVIAEINAKDKEGNFKWAAIRAGVLGAARYGTVDDKLEAVMRFVEALCASPAMQLAHRRYIDATRQLAAQGIYLIVAAGNDHNTLDTHFPLPPGAEFNDLAKSPYVIPVAAADTNGTPGHREDDRIASFSSRGDGNLWNPVIAAPGQEIRISRPFGGIGRNQVVNGTSYATPYTCGVVSMMLQKNPSLTFEQVRATLQATATRTPFPCAEQGAGMLNPEAAVMSA